MTASLSDRVANLYCERSSFAMLLLYIGVFPGVFPVDLCYARPLFFSTLPKLAVSHRLVRDEDHLALVSLRLENPPDQVVIE